MKSQIAGYVAALLAFVLLDAIWLMVVAGPGFKAALGPLMRDQPLLLPAGAFYPIYIFGLLMLAIRPATTVRSAAAKGALLGLAAYATFDLTNISVIEGWPVALSLMDFAWGIFASATAAAVGFAAMRWMR